MFEKIAKYSIALSILVIIAGSGLYFYIQSKNGSSFIEGSYAPVDFTDIDHRPADDAYLFCDSDLCQKATADAPYVILDGDFKDAISAIRRLTASPSRYTLLAFDIPNTQFDLGEPIAGRPYYGVVSVRLLEDDQGMTPTTGRADKTIPKQRTKIAVYAFQPLGKSAKADHAERANNIITDIKAALRSF